MSDEKKNNISPEKYYSAKSIVDMGILPYWKSRMTFVRKLREEKWMKVFQPITEKTEKTTRFYLKGEHVIKYLDSIKSPNQTKQ